MREQKVKCKFAATVTVKLPQDKIIECLSGLGDFWECEEDLGVTLAGEIPGGGTYYPATMFNRYGDPGGPEEWDVEPYITEKQIEDAIHKRFPEADVSVEIWEVVDEL